MRSAVLTLIAACALVVPGAASAATGLPDREADPVVLDGSQVPALLGADPGKVVAFSFDGGWRQVPVQVDERAMIDYPTVRQGYQAGGRPFTHLAYTDPGTYAGADPDPSLDADDEIAAMAKDSGDNAQDRDDPAGVVAGSRVRIGVADPLDPSATRYLYLFRTDGTLDPSAGASYVHYDFNLLSGDYKTTYQFSGLPNGDSSQSGPPGNPENSRVSTDFYSEHLASRWIGDELEISAGSSTGVDILDGDKAQVAYGCGRSELTFSRGGGGFIANKSGPVRAIRSYIGANSGTFTQRDDIYYQRSQVTNTYLRVHPGISTITQYLDYSPAAAGMTYRNSAQPAGVTVDGIPDPSVETDGSLGPATTWEQVEGQQGTLSVVNRMVTDMPGLNVGSFYEDDLTPATAQCSGYADSEAWGASGQTLTNAGQNTDPTLGAAYNFTGTRTIYVSEPGGDAALAAKRSLQVDSPLAVTVGAPKLHLLGPAPKKAKVGKPEFLRLRIENRGNALAEGIEICGKAPKKLVKVGRCSTLDRLGGGVARNVRIKVRLRHAAAGKHSIPVKLVARSEGLEPARDQAKLKPS
jgi:hypothetical protein